MNHRLRTTTQTLVLVFGVGLPVPSCGQAPTGARNAPLFVDAWIGGPLDSVYTAEYTRIQDVCRGQGDACYHAELDTTAYRLAPVYPEPEAVEPAGWLAVRLQPRGAWPYASMLFVDQAGRQTTLIDDVGDWGYGTNLDVSEARDGWIRPGMLASVGGLWLGTESGPGFGVVDGPYGLEGRLWRLGPLPVGGPAGDPVVPEGVYMVLNVVDGTVRLRPELPTDMECGEPTDSAAAAATPPVYELALADLSDASGRPLVEVAYGKGC